MKLQIGAKGPAISGFRKLDLVQWGDVEFVQDARALSNFSDDSVAEIYASHVLEHFKAPETAAVLTEWRRVLEPGGTLWVSVPDFEAAVRLYLATGYLGKFLQDFLHGGQEYETAVHYRSFTGPVLTGLLNDAGFRQVERLEKLPYGVGDCSTLLDSYTGRPISINVRGIK